MLPPLVVHVMHRFDTGGLENGVVNLINHMPSYRHLVIALSQVTDFRLRLRDPGVECLSLGKVSGHGAKVYPALWRLLRERRPTIVHTRNLAALEMQPAAWAARVPVRIHGEHGRDTDDLDGTSLRQQRLRRLYAPFVQHWVALSKDLQGYLAGPVGIAADRITQIYNGVDTQRFHPAAGALPDRIAGCPFDPAAHVLIGTVGRMAAVKDQVMLARAFVQAAAADPAFGQRARLVMVGEGPLRAPAQAVLDDAGLGALAWLPGERQDIAEVMRGLHVFVLPSLAEGISNTILEAMASGLPVVATAVGGNPELVAAGRTGALVPAREPAALAQTLVEWANDPAAAAACGRAGREAVVRRFSLTTMVADYGALYDRLLAAKRAHPQPAGR
jgi:sugar transferase (PEP-CTERM/EpsH1 system associated)